jgi:hypothetical protein
MGDKSQKMGKLMFKGEWKMSDVRCRKAEVWIKILAG